MDDIFHKLNKKNDYHVFLFSSPAPLPYSFISHTYFVIFDKGKISRWEILFSKNLCKTGWNHLHLNALSPMTGLSMNPFKMTSPYWNSKLIGHISGNVNSTARKIIKLLNRCDKVYPFNNIYFATGPNSNTFTQWILNHFPESSLKLPWNALGKGYKLNKK